MATGGTENKGITGAQDKGGVVYSGDGEPTTVTDAHGKKVQVTLAAHWSHEGKDYLPGDKVKVDADTAAGLRSSGYAEADG